MIKGCENTTEGFFQVLRSFRVMLVAQQILEQQKNRPFRVLYVVFPSAELPGYWVSMNPVLESWPRHAATGGSLCSSGASFAKTGKSMSRMSCSSVNTTTVE